MIPKHEAYIIYIDIIDNYTTLYLQLECCKLLSNSIQIGLKYF